MAGPKILIWDIESTNLNGVFGVILCIGYKWYGEKKVHVLTLMDCVNKGMHDDRGLVDEFAKIYEQADYTVAHYGQRFDLPMIQMKRCKYRQPMLPPIPLVDTWRIARDNFKMHSNRLDAIAKYLGVENEKTPITADDWILAALGSRTALKQVVHHCRQDVLVLEDVFRLLRPYSKEPSRQLFGAAGCISCGGVHLQRRGHAVTRSRRYQRLHCQDCGKWMRETKSDAKSELV